MLKGTFPVEKFKQLSTPFYYYDVKLLQDTLDVVKTESGKYGYHVHYAVKANANPRILSIIAANGLGADCVSGGEVQAALDAGFPADKIVFAGVGKADWEINLGLDNDIFCFNVESAVELGIINELAAAKNKVASIALRINPEVDAHTHAKITTGMKENKFGINLSQLGGVLDKLKEMKNVKGPITEINQDSFWDLIHETKNACGQDMDAMLAYLKDRLVSMGPTQAQNFHDIIHAYEDLADKFGLWDAAGIMKEYGCSDDGFIDFRAWLIAQGREVYFAALADPDSLADVVPYGDCRFEQLSYVGDYAYEQLTGKSAYDQTDWSAYESLLMKLEQDIVYKDGIEFPREGADLKKYLPRLCAKHPEWDGQTRWNLQLKEIRDLIHAGKDYDRCQTSNKKKRSRGGEAR